jgi:riboflavin transporter FmnP
MLTLNSRRIALTSFFLSLGIVLPFVFHQFALAGRIFLPMHIPVFLAGIFAGPVSGIIVGVLSPVISFFLTGMPPPYAVPLMAMELPIYGLSIGLLNQVKKFPLILSLIVSMILGRAAFALGLLILGRFFSLPYGFSTFLEITFITGLPGIGLQIVIIPALVKGVSWLGKTG